MSFFIHLKSEFDALVEVNNLPSLFIKAKEESSHYIENTSEKPVYFKVTPINPDKTYKKLLPYAGAFNINLQTKVSNPLMDCVLYPNNHYEITFLKNSLASHTLPTILEQKSFFIKAKEHTVTVFFDGICQISVQDKELIFAKELPYKIKDVHLEKLKNKDIIVLQAKTESLENYYLILHHKNSSYEVVTEGLLEKVELTGDAIITLQKINDMAGHARVEEFDCSSYNVSKINSYFVYLKEKPKVVSLKTLVPFAFLEAIKVKNFTLARNYLTDEFSEKLMDEHLEAYFGEFLDVVPANYEKNAENKIALIKKEKHKFAKIYSIEFDKNKISNISEC